MIKDKNNIPSIANELKKVMNSTIEIGVLSDKSDSEVLTYAGVNEYGAEIPITVKSRNFLHAIGIHVKASTTTVKIPERAFIRTAFDDQEEVNKSVKKFGKFLFNLIESSNDAKAALDFLGADLVSLVRENIVSDIGPSNHPVTTERKGAGKSTLYDTGHLQRSINYEVN